jgi:TolB protein
VVEALLRREGMGVSENALLAQTRGYLLRVSLVALAALLAAVLVALGGTEKPAEAAFPGKNGRIAFVSDRDGDWEIYTKAPHNPLLEQVTHNSIIDLRPAWSPDGTKIAFERNNNIFVKDTSNGQQVRLTEDSLANGPAWSADGTKIAFASFRDGDQEIYTMNSSDGSELRKLTDNQNHDVHPTWSPDGTKIVFERDYDIWIMDADGTDQKNLTGSPSLSEYEPDWSPDGTQIAFEKWGGDLGFQTDIISIKADGSGLVNLTNTPDVSEDFPAWSPNGRKIAYSVSFGDLWMMNADGSRQVNLTKTPEISDFGPDWQPAPVPRG